MRKIGRTLRDGTRLLWIFQTVAMAEYFRGPEIQLRSRCIMESVNGSLKTKKQKTKSLSTHLFGGHEPA